MFHSDRSLKTTFCHYFTVSRSLIHDVKCGFCTGCCNSKQ